MKINTWYWNYKTLTYVIRKRNLYAKTMKFSHVNTNIDRIFMNKFKWLMTNIELAGGSKKKSMNTIKCGLCNERYININYTFEDNKIEWEGQKEHFSFSFSGGLYHYFDAHKLKPCDLLVNLVDNKWNDHCDGGSRIIDK